MMTNSKMSPDILTAISTVSLLMTATLPAVPVWQSGDANLTFSPGNGASIVVNDSPIPDWFGPAPDFQLSQTVVGNDFVSSAQGGIFHIEIPRLFGLLIPCQTSVFQEGGISGGFDPASFQIQTTSSPESTWTIEGTQFGPVDYGVAFFLYVHGEVAPGANSFARFEATATWGPEGSSRSVFDFSETITTPGEFTFAPIFDFEELVPNFLSVGAEQTISLSLTLTAYGVDGLSSIILGCPDDPGAPPFIPPIDIPFIPPRFQGPPPGGGAGNGLGVHAVPEAGTAASTMALSGLVLLALRRRTGSPGLVKGSQ